MCIGGGGGDGGAAEAARQAEQRAKAEQDRVSGAVAKLNAMFGVETPMTDKVPGAEDLGAQVAANKAARERIYGGLQSAVSDLNTGNLDREYQQAGREVNFDAARRGLFGGSAYADQLGNLNSDRNTALMKISSAAQQAATDARVADDKTRLGLAGQITGGLDEATALESARNQLDANSASVRQQATTDQLSGFFNNLLGSIRNSAQQQGLASAWQKYGPASMPGNTVSGGTIYGR